MNVINNNFVLPTYKYDFSLVSKNIFLEIILIRAAAFYQSTFLYEMFNEEIYIAFL